MFGMKKKKTIDCEFCGEGIEKTFDYCPFCGEQLFEEEESEDFGMLGKNEEGNLQENVFSVQGLGVMDKMLGGLMNNLVKTLNKEFSKEINKQNKTEVRSYPNGINITIGNQESKQEIASIKKISDKLIEKMSGLPRTSAKTNVKRINDKVIYELLTPGLESKDDVIISKLERGYEIKAVSPKKVYVNTIPISLPLKNLSVDNNRLYVEFTGR
jgi:hypothetical protein